MDPQRMRLALCLLVSLALTPLAAAQASDPVGVVCGLLGGNAPDVRDQVPICPGEPAAPAGPGAAAHDHAAPQDAPDAAQGIAQRGIEDAQGIAADPQSAPSRLAGLLAALVQFVKDLLELPVDAALAVEKGEQAANDAIRQAVKATGQATLGTGRAIADATRTITDAVLGLFEREASATTPQKGALPVETPRLGRSGLQLLEIPNPIAR